MKTRIGDIGWPLDKLDDAVGLLAERLGQVTHSPASTNAPLVDGPLLAPRLEHALHQFGLEADEVLLTYQEAERPPVPSVVVLPSASDAGAARVVLLAGRRGGHLTVLGTDRRWATMDVREWARHLRAGVGHEERAAVGRMLDATGVARGRRARVLSALVDDQLSEVVVARTWQVGVDPGTDFVRQLAAAGVRRATVRLLGLYAAYVALWVVSWVVVGRAALAGRIDWGWLTAWSLLLATIVPLQVWTATLQGSLALTVGRVLKTRLLVGALRIAPDRLRSEGAGQFLGRVLESGAVEGLALGGGLQAVLAAVELAMAGLVLALGVTPRSHVLLLAGVTVSMLVVASGYHRMRVRWSQTRLAMTHDLVEGIAGYRTRTVQQLPAYWHDDEDRHVDTYLVRSAALDRWVPWLLVGVPRGFTAAALALLVPAFVDGRSPGAVAATLGGVLMATLALQRVADALSTLSGALVAWREARPLFDAAADRPAPVSWDAPLPTERRDQACLDVRDVGFTYGTRTTPALTSCSIRAGTSDRLLLAGASGSGKSTLASLIAGWRTPSSGLVLVDGLDRRTLCPHGWRRRVVAAPQFHENHIFCETFAFNLLMGRAWPPRDADLADAEEIALELGLGDLLQRMPAGLYQMVGEGGWQLSQGERSRVFMARALLQNSRVLILDESFGALDPETLRQSMDCVLRRAPTLIVIAHP